MNFTNSEELEKELLRLHESNKKPFEPIAFHNHEGDCVEFLVTPEEYYGKREDDLVTVFYGLESNEIIGALIKGIKRLIHEADNTEINISDGKVSLQMLFLMASQKSGKAQRTLNYNTLMTMADDLEVELCAA